MKRLTIFTPTYNRAYILPKLYESLCVQTCQDFEWLVVDDGSTDNTRELVKEWEQEHKITIRYFYQENAGKMIAHNKAVKESQAELFMCVDSDDRLCVENVIADVLSFWNQEKVTDNPAICGIIGYKQIEHKTECFPESMRIVHLSDLFEKGFSGETALIIKREVLAKYPFPYFEGEKFVTDVYVYDQIDRDYQFLLFPYTVQDCRYHDDGYSNHYMKLLFENPLGYRAYHNQCVLFKKKGYLKSVVCYIALSLRIRDERLFSNAANLPLTILLLPLGVMKYFYDNFRLSRL